MMSRILCFLFAALIAGCAQVGSPTGGPKDEQGPKVVFANPSNLSTGFNGSTVTLEFDEFVVTNTLSQNIIVSPRLSEKPKVKNKGKILEIQFEETLTPNTTFHLQFGEGIADLHEGNKLDSNVWVFSTGNYLDSGLIAGRCASSLEGSPSGGIWVFLYSNFNDSTPYLNRPLYISKTDESGRFEIPYLPDGKYRLFASSDENRNYLFDSPSEKIGFVDNWILTGNDSLRISIFTENKGGQLIQEKSLSGGIVELKTRLPFDSVVVKALGVEVELEQRKIGDDSTIVWSPAMPEDSLTLICQFDDWRDTVELKQSKNPKLKFAVGKYDPAKPSAIEVSTNYPVKLAEIRASVLPPGDSVSSSVEFTRNGPFSFVTDFLPDTSGTHLLMLEIDSITGLFVSESDSISLKFQIADSSKWSSLMVELDSGSGGYVVQLLDAGKKQVGILPLDNGKCQFDRLMKGSYNLSLIKDLDGNGEWTTGDYLLGRQPERIIRYSSPIEIKSGFDQIINWTIQN